MFKQFTLGIEEEFQIVDPHTRGLRSHVSEVLEEGKMLLGEACETRMIQSMIEVGTGICKDIKETRSDITNLRGILSGLGRAKRWATSTQFSSAAPSADEQLQVWRKTGDVNAVVDHLIEATMENVPRG